METERTKAFKLVELHFLKIKVGNHIILRDDGWFDGGNNFVRVSQKHTDREAS